MDSVKILSFTYARRYGVEMEVNSFDKRDFKLFPLNKEIGEKPKGIDEIAYLIKEKLGETVHVKGWQYTNDNNHWEIKPDSSCGMELCSPVSKGWTGLKKICEVAEVIKNDHRISADDRCSLHVHVEMPEHREIVSKVLYYWIKCESVFLDSVPYNRKTNRYCQCIGMNDFLEHDTDLKSFDIIKKLGIKKYHSINSYHMLKQNRNTIEFRVAEAAACTNPFLVKNWIRLLLHFVERASKANPVENYKPGNPWTGLCWLDPVDTMKLLGFTEEYELSKGLKQTRDWFVARLYRNILNPQEKSVFWSQKVRKVSFAQIESLMERFSIKPEDVPEILSAENPDLYSNEYKM